MRNKFFKFNENYAKVIKHLDDRQAGQYVRAISDYAFEGKTYGGKDTAVKTAFTLTKQMIDDEKFYREKGRLGGGEKEGRKRKEGGGKTRLYCRAVRLWKDLIAKCGDGLCAVKGGDHKSRRYLVG